MHSESLSSPCTSLNYNRLAFPVSWAPCDWHLCLQNRAHIRFQKVGHLPTIGIPKAIYHYVTNTTKQQPTYQLFQNIMRPKNQLVNPPKMKKFNSICAFSRFLLQLWPLKLGQLANQSGSSRHMTCKMQGNRPSCQGSHAPLQEGFAYCYMMQNAELICTLCALPSEQKIHSM